MRGGEGGGEDAAGIVFVANVSQRESRDSPKTWSRFEHSRSRAAVSASRNAEYDRTREEHEEEGPPKAKNVRD